MVGYAGIPQNSLRLRAKRAVADHHETQSGAQRRHSAKSRDERMRQVGLVLDCLHPPDGTDQPEYRVVERAARDRRPAGRCHMESADIHAIVELRNSGLRNAYPLHQIRLKITR